MEGWWLPPLFGIAGAVLGLAADRFATRWPEHDEEHPAGRPVGWRTVVCVAVGAVAFGALPLRFAFDVLALVVFGAWFATLVVGLATVLPYVKSKSDKLKVLATMGAKRATVAPTNRSRRRM